MIFMPEPESVKNSGKLVLIVDDDESIVELLEFMVQKEGFRTAKALDGEEGLRQAQALTPDLILLDLMLPLCGGYEVLRRLQSGETAKIPVIVITGRSADRTTKDMIRQEANVVEFMEKPVKAAVLAMAIHGILKTRPPELGLAGSGEF